MPPAWPEERGALFTSHGVRGGRVSNDIGWVTGPPPTQFQVDHAPGMIWTMRGIVHLKLVNGRGEPPQASVEAVVQPKRGIVTDRRPDRSVRVTITSRSSI